jgi:hypothetical protein
VQATDACAIAVGDTNVNVTLELDGANFGYNSSYFSVRLSANNTYVV